VKPQLLSATKLLLVLVLFFSSHYSQGQKTLITVTQDYFRSNPYTQSFSDFLRHLTNDPTMVNKKMQKRSDSTLFYFTGRYTTHNPFFFKADTVTTYLMEHPAVIGTDSLQQIDTLMIYMLVASLPYSKEAEQTIKKDAEKIKRRVRKAFDTSDTLTTSGDAFFTNYYYSIHPISPFSVATMGPDEHQRMNLLIIVRFKIDGNEAVLPGYRSTREIDLMDFLESKN